MSDFARQAERTARLLQLTPGWKRLQQLHPDCDDETARAILDEAASFSEGVLHPLNTPGDRRGCTVSESRVRTPAGFADAYRQYAQAGWLGMDVPETFGGQSLPLTVQAACSSLFERGCVALMMAAGSSRAASHLLARAADAATAAEWVPRLVAGEWAATICISEPDAGSDVGRLRTRAERSNGEWRISGQKIWISFGDHDMTERIGHCLLARTGEAPGTRGLSLFLVPNRIDGEPNGITLERIEEKMGLHGSPTCALRFDGARGTLIGEPGRGLPELFAMIELMRLLTACQGLGIASASADIAEAYAAERRQGGPPEAPPVPIAAHPDVRRQLQEIRSRTEVLRAAVLELATIMDLARLEPDPQLRSQLSDLAGWMLPLIKNFGAGAGFDVANAAIQVLGGAGYTKDWPLEQYLRDSRVMTIYEGTTGMQALDFLTRRLWREEGRGLRLFQARARQEIGDLAARHPDKAEEALRTLDTFDAFSTRLTALQPDPDTALYQAHAYMTAAWAAVTAWMTLRLQQSAGGFSPE